MTSTRFPHTLDMEASLPMDITIPEYRASRTCKARTHRPLMYALAYMVAFCAAMATLTVGATHAMASTPTTCPKDHTVVYEDDPCWSWSQDGNTQRGVTLKSGEHVVLDVCAFQRADRAKRIDWKRTEKLRGDMIARQRKGC